VITTLERLSAMLVKDYQLAPNVLTLDASFETLGIDSLGTAELLFNVEDVFGITIPSRPIELATLGDVVRYIDELTAAQQTGSDSDPTGKTAVNQNI
jgi:acyl carrier protein